MQTNNTAHTSPSTSVLMSQVMLALVPGTLIMFWQFGWGVIINIAMAIIACALVEAAALLLRKRPVLTTLSDGSACLAGWLLALALPPLLPWWIICIGCGAAMLLGKHLYGGLGFNPFNPAMVGYALLLVSFPRDMSAWLSPEISLSFQEILHYVYYGREQIATNWDAITQATPLDNLNTMSQRDTDTSTYKINHMTWAYINIAFLLGGLYLLYQRIITWHIPAALLATLCFCYTCDWLLFSGSTTPWSALFSGASMLAAFFIATDPVSAATSRYGRLVYAAGVGLIIFVIRQWGQYPDGVAFAILIMNMAAPAIDYFYRPKAFGQ